MYEWIDSHKTLLVWLSALSIALSVAGILAAPWLAGRIPVDYFLDKKRHPSPWARHHPALRALVILGKNLLGLLLLAIGVAMVPLPGPGMPILIVGMLLVDFPGKYRLERWVISRPPMAKGINWMRGKAGAPPLEMPPPPHRDQGAPRGTQEQKRGF